jgi:AbrB family looped-hinge helix DNA binding protein
MDTATLSSKGQLVIPKHVRALAHANAGDAFYVQYVQGEIRLRPVGQPKSSTLDEVAGCLARADSKPLTDAQVKAAIQAKLKAQDLTTMQPR